MYPQKFTDYEFFDFYRTGCSDSEMAAALGVTRQAIRKRRLRMGLAINGRPRTVPSEPLPGPEAIEEMRNSGESFASIGRRYGVSRQAVQVALRRGRNVIKRSTG